MTTQPQILNFFSFMEDREALLKFSLVNSLLGFISQIKYNQEFLAAKSALSLDTNSFAPFVVNRAIQLINSNSDIRFVHPYDSAIAGYIFLLYESSMPHALSLIKRIASKKLPNLFWTNSIANYVAHSPTMRTGDFRSTFSPSSIKNDKMELKKDSISMGSITNNGTVNYQIKLLE